MQQESETVSWLWLLVIVCAPTMATAAVGSFLLWSARQRDKGLRPETWEKARELKRTGGFIRPVRRRIAVAMDRDELELECGHRISYWRDSPEERYDCSRCEDAWIEYQKKRELGTIPLFGRLVRSWIAKSAPDPPA